MADVAEMGPNRVGGANQRRSENADNGKDAKSRASEPGLPRGDLIFDAAALHAQLADLLSLYLARAADPDAIEKCSAKDAIACAKTLTGMMSDLQSGRPSSVDADTEWSRMELPSVGRGPVPRHLHNAKSGNGGPRVAALQPESTSIPILEDALAVVLASTEESQIPIPHERFLARIEKLCKETQKRLLNSRSGGLQTTTPSIARPGDRASVQVDGGMGVPPVIPPNTPARRRCHQGFSDNCANDTKSRASEPACTCGVADKPGLLNMDATSSSPADDGRLETDGCSPGLLQKDPPVGRPPVGRRLDTGMGERRGTGPRPTTPIPNPSPLTSSPSPPSNNQQPTTNNRGAAPRKRRSLYTLGSSLRFGTSSRYALHATRYSPAAPT